MISISKNFDMHSSCNIVLYKYGMFPSLYLNVVCEGSIDSYYNESNLDSKGRQYDIILGYNIMHILSIFVLSVIKTFFYFVIITDVNE